MRLGGDRTALQATFTTDSPGACDHLLGMETMLVKILLGVDVEGCYRPSVDLLARMKFESSELTLAHSIDLTFSMLAYGTPVSPTYGADLLQNFESIGRQTLVEAEQAAKGLDMTPEKVLLNGAAGAAMMEYADQIDAAVIVVHADRKSALGSLFLGSVSRGLTIGAHQSILISKGAVGPQGPIHAVLATDHSLYANHAIDRFLLMKAKGIESIHVVTALNLDDYTGHPHGEHVERLGSPLEHILMEEAEAQNARVVAKLSEAGYSSSSSVRFNTTNKAIEEAMNEMQADLLLIGAQGHGFVHRLFIGSTSLHQVVAEPYPVFVLRTERRN